MIKYLTNEEIIEINKIALEISGELKEFQIKDIFDINSAMKFVEDNFGNDLLKKTLGYCIALFVYHPFQEGNHRTSLISAQEFLIKNDYYSNVSDNERKQLQKWRFEYEEENELERKFLCITCIENRALREVEIKKVMNSEYGNKILDWLKRNYKLRTNGL